MVDYPPDCDYDSVLGKPMDCSDFDWWREHTADPTTRYCQMCEPDRDPLAELLEPYPCGKHSEAGGGADRAVTARRVQEIGL